MVANVLTGFDFEELEEGKLDEIFGFGIEGGPDVFVALGCVLRDGVAEIDGRELPDFEILLATKENERAHEFIGVGVTSLAEKVLALFPECVVVGEDVGDDSHKLFLETHRFLTQICIFKKEGQA